MIEIDFSFQVYNAFVKFRWPQRLIEGMVRLCCTEELAAQNREREANLRRAEYVYDRGLRALPFLNGIHEEASAAGNRFVRLHL